MRLYRILKVQNWLGRDRWQIQALMPLGWVNVGHRYRSLQDAQDEWYRVATRRDEE